MNGIYIHIPFCQKKCNYCDFSSYPSLVPKSDEYIDALCREMSLYKGESANTIYFGGGTPSLLTEFQIGRIIDALDKNLHISRESEITIEVNPCTVTQEKAKAYSKMGFNRISLGAQSFVDQELAMLGRLHKSCDTVRAYSTFTDAGFENISLDLMYALPDQTMETLSTSIGEMLNLEPKHISCYGLKIEEDTVFGNMLSTGQICEKTDDEYADMYEFICNTLSENGYEQYELSNFCRAGYESKHNLKYWQMKDYIGLGLSAASCYRLQRYTRTHDYAKYIECFENEEIFTLSEKDRQSEYMILSLRLVKQGARKSEFEKMFGKQVEDVFGDVIKKHLESGLITDTQDSYVLSPKAYYISNSVLCDFV